MPLSWRARQWWDAMPRSQRINRVLYGLALVSMLGLLAELGLGSPETDVDLASSPGAGRSLTSTTTQSSAPTTFTLPDTPTAPGGLSLADILAQITIPSIPGSPDDAVGAGGSGSGGAGGSPAPARSTATTAPPRSQPAGGGGGGGGGSPSSPGPAPTQAPQSNPPPANPDPDPPGPSPTTAPSQPTQTTRTTVPRTTPTFPDFGVPTTTACGRRCP